MPTGLDGHRAPLRTASRSSVLERLASEISVVAQSLERNALIGVDGIDGAGKSTLADELAQVLVTRHHDVLRATIDSFHHPRAMRYRRSRDSPEGFFYDSHDLPALIASLLHPVRAGYDTVVTSCFDVEADEPDPGNPLTLTGHTIVLFDGIFLLRGELAEYWDLCIHVEARDRVARQRIQRAVGDETDPLRRFARLLDGWSRVRRYVQGQALYFATCAPLSRATIVVDNNDLAAPHIVDKAAVR